MEELKSISHAIAERTILLEGADFLSAAGFTQTPNHLLTDKRISHGAKIAYALLLRYAWQNNFCFPGQEKLAEDMGSTSRQVRNYLTELKQFEYLKVKQRGMGRTNIYILNLRVKPKKGR